MNRQVFTGAAIFDGETLRTGRALIVEDGRVAGIVPEGGERGATRLTGGVLSPGFIDLQVNGGDGIMLDAHAGVEGIERICAAHARLGTLGLLPTLITDTREATRAVIEAGAAVGRARAPGFLGLHLEGPHLDPRRKGAHDPALIRPMEAEDLATLIAAARRLPALMVTLAPEAATPDQIEALARAGVIVSLGHSDCSYDAAMAAINAGARTVTHLFNAMSPLGHREPGLAGAALDAGEASAGLIADGIHVAPAAMRVALAAKRLPGRIFLVTDAMAVAGTDLAEFALGGRRILRAHGRLTLADGTLAGADCDMPQCLRVLVRDVGIDLAEALRMATVKPAEVLSLEPPRLRPGAAADFVHLDRDFALAGAWRGGHRLATAQTRRPHRS